MIDYLEQQITELSLEYYKLVGIDHHKDRDCHWYIKRVWSYGSEPYWAVEHHGYIYGVGKYSQDSVYEKHDSYENALRSLRWHLKEAIDLIRNINGETWVYDSV